MLQLLPVSLSLQFPFVQSSFVTSFFLGYFLNRDQKEVFPEGAGEFRREA